MGITMSVAIKLRENDLACCSALVSSHLESCVEFWLSSTRRTWKHKRESSKLSQRWLRDWRVCYMRRGWESHNCFNGRRKTEGELSVGVRKAEPNSSQSNCRIEAKNTNWYVLFKQQKKILPKGWLEEVAQRGCGRSNLDIIQSPAGLHPCQLALLDSVLKQRHWTRWSLEILSNLSHSAIL